MKSMNLVGDPIINLLKKIAIPASTGTLFQTLYNVVDTYFAGKISPNALAAIAKSFPLYFIIIATGVGIVAASNALISNSLGAKENRKASMYVAQSLLYSVIVSIFVTIIVVSIMFWFLNRTKTGTSMRAYSDNEDLALLSGIDPKKSF